MNTLERQSITSPFNKTDECAKFTIDDSSCPFTLRGVTITGQCYTYSMWLKSDTPGNIGVADASFQSNTEWQKCSVTFTATSEDVPLHFRVSGTYYIYHPQLEIGNKATDWTPAPEDVEQNIADAESRVNDTIIEKEASILSTSEGITLSALESYVKTDEFYEFKESTESEFVLRSDELSLKFEGVEKTVSEVDGELQSAIEQWSKHFIFSENGLTISNGDNTIELQLDNQNGIIFSRNGIPFGLWDGVDFFTGNIVVKVNERAQLGGFAFVPRSDGSLSFLKIGCEIVITVHPQSQTVIVGNSVTLTVEAEGKLLTYQWQESIGNGNNFTDIPGATSNTYTFVAKRYTAMTSTQYGDIEIALPQAYRCVITDAVGASIASSGANITVNKT